MKSVVICYKAINPMIVNEGTQYEKKFDTFLLCYVGGLTIEQANAMCETVNTEKPEKLWNTYNLNWKEIASIYAKEQEEMCG